MSVSTLRRLAATLLVAALGACASGDDAAPDINLSIEHDYQSGDDHVLIRHRDWPDCAWTLRMPEYVILHREIDSKVTVAGTRNDTTGAVILTARGGADQSELEMTFIPGPDRVDITATVTNTGEAPWDSSASALACLVFADAPEFFDEDTDRTWLRAEGRIHTVAELRKKYWRRVPRHNSHPLHPRDVEWHTQKRRNRRAIPAENSLIIRSDAGARHLVGFAWDDAYSVAYNLDPELNCMHSNPRLGALRPGESRTLHGRIYFFDGSPRGLEAQFGEDFPSLGFGPAGDEENTGLTTRDD